MPSHQIQSPVWSLRKGCWTFAPFLNPWYAWGGGGAGGGREDDEDAWSRWGGGNEGRENDEDAWSGFAGPVGWGVGGREVAAFPAWFGAGAPLFRLARLGGTGGSGAGEAWGLKKGCVACWPRSLSGGSADVCMFAFAWLRMRSASLVTVSACFYSLAGECVSFLTFRKIGVLHALSTLGHPFRLVGRAFSVSPKNKGASTEIGRHRSGNST